MVSDDKMKAALADDAETVDKTSQEGLDYTEAEEDSSRTKEDYDNKHKEVEGILMPLVQKVYQSICHLDKKEVCRRYARRCCMVCQTPEDPSDSGPKVEEVD